MTPNLDDLIADIEKTTCVVEVATGVLTKAPKKETANITNNKKKMRLNQILVAKAFSESAPKIAVTAVPKRT